MPPWEVPMPTTEAGKQYVDARMVEFYEEFHSDHTEEEYRQQAAIERTAQETAIEAIEREAVEAALTPERIADYLARWCEANRPIHAGVVMLVAAALRAALTEKEAGS